MRKTMLAGLATIMAMIVTGCGVTVEHKVEPIYITVDVNIRIQRELEKVFEFEKARGEFVDAQDAAKTIAR